MQLLHGPQKMKSYHQQLFSTARQIPRNYHSWSFSKKEDIVQEMFPVDEVAVAIKSYPKALNGQKEDK